MRSHRQGRQALTFAILAIGVASFAVLQSLILPALTEIRQHYGTDQATASWVLTAYLLSASIATPVIGRLGDTFGKSRLFYWTLLALSVGSLLAAVAPSIGWLIAARVIQGVGGGLIPLAYGIIRDEFGKRVRSAVSIMSSLTAAGFGFGIVLAGPIINHLGYTWLFWLPMIATLTAAGATWLFVPPSPDRSPGRVPLLSGLLLCGWLVAGLLGISRGNSWGWTSPALLGLFSLSAVLGVLWFWAETRASVPMIDLQMMRRRGVWTSNMVSGFVGFSVFASFGFLPQFLQTPTSTGYGLGESISGSGNILLPSSIGTFVVALFTAPLVARFGVRIVVQVGTVWLAVAFAGVAFWHDSTWHLVAATTAQGVGAGLVFASLAGVVIASVPRNQTGTASGMNANIRTIGGSIGAAIMAGIVTAHVDLDGYPSERAYEVGFLVLGLAMIPAFVAALFLPERTERAATSRLSDAVDAELGYVPGAPVPVDPDAVGSRDRVETTPKTWQGVDR